MSRPYVRIHDASAIDRGRSRVFTNHDGEPMAVLSVCGVEVYDDDPEHWAALAAACMRLASELRNAAATEVCGDCMGADATIVGDDGVGRCASCALVVVP